MQFEACYDIINEALTTGYCHPQNDFYDFPKVSINPHCFSENGPKLYVTATSKSVVEWAAKKALPLTFKWDDSLVDKESYAVLYNKVAMEHGIDTSSVEHQLTVIVNLNSNGDIAREETMLYLNNYIIETYPDIDHISKINQIISENAIGTNADYYAPIKLAVEKTGVKNILLSLESMRSPHDIVGVINMVNNKIFENIKG